MNMTHNKNKRNEFMRSRFIKSILFTLTIALLGFLTGCEAQNAGSSFAIQFTFPDDQWPEGNLWLSGRVEERPEIQADGTVLSIASPVLLEPGATLAFSAIAFGNDRVVVAEIRATESSSGRPLYYGVSDQFDFNAGDNIVVEVPFELIATPAAETTNTTNPGTGESTGSSTSSMTIGTETESNPGTVGVTDVLLHVTTTNADKVIVSNDPAFSDENTSRLNFSDYEPTAEADTTRSYQLPWSLKGCANSNSVCSQTVYLMFEDSFGYSSSAISDSVELDTKVPEVINSGTRMEPNSIKANVSGIFRLSVDEPLSGLSNSSDSINDISDIDFMVTRNGMPLDEPVLRLIDVSEGEDGGLWETISPGGQGPLTSGNYVIHANLTDKVGNIFSTQDANTPLAEFSVDAQEPTATQVSLLVNGSQTKRDVKLGDTIELSFTASESIVGNPEVYIGTVPMELVQEEEESYIYRYTPELGQPDAAGDALVDGIYIVSVRLVDEANNVGITNLTDDTLTFDVVPPNIIDGSAYPPAANQDSNLTYQIFLTESVSAISLNALHETDDTATIEFQESESTGNVYTFEPIEPLATELEGNYYPTVTMEDGAGNTSTFTYDPTMGDSNVLMPIALDSSDPTISLFNIATSNTVAGNAQCGVQESALSVMAANNDTVTITFDASDANGNTINDLPLVTVGNQPAGCSQTPDTESYTCTVLVTNSSFADGLSAVQVTVTDNAGNTTEYADASVCIDSTAPDIIRSDVYPVAANRDSELTYQVFLSEAASYLELTATHTGDGSTLSFPNPPVATGSVYTFSLTDPDESSGNLNPLQFATEGIYLPTLTIVDYAGNTAVYEYNSESNLLVPIQVDSTQPVIGQVSLTTTNANFETDSLCGNDADGLRVDAADNDIVTLSFTATDIGSSGINSAPEAKLGNQAILCEESGDSYTRNYTCNVVISSDAYPGGLNTFEVTVVDVGGNSTAVTSASVCVDTTAPTATTNVQPNKIKIGTNIVYQAVFSEPVLNTSIVAVHTNGTDQLELTKNVEASTSNLGVWTHKVIEWDDHGNGLTSGTREGTYTVTIQTTDEAGNPSATITGESIEIDSVLPSATFVSRTVTQNAQDTIQAADFFDIAQNPAAPVLRPVVINGHTIVTVVQIDDSATETLDAPQVIIGDLAATATEALGNNQWQSTHVIDSETSNGLAATQVKVTDAAGNQFSGAIPNRQIVADLAPPELAYRTVSPSVVNNGGAATVILNFNELVRSPDVKLVHGPLLEPLGDLDGLSVSCEPNPGTNASDLGATNIASTVVGSSFVCTISSSPTVTLASSYELGVEAVDYAGNKVVFTAAEFAQTLNFDQSAPVLELSNLSSGRTTSDLEVANQFPTVNESDQGASRTIHVTLTANELLDPDSLTVLLGDTPMECTPDSLPGDAGNVTNCHYDLSPTDTDGYKCLKVIAVDLAGNVTDIDTTTFDPLKCVLFDFTPPVVAYASVSPQSIPANGRGNMTTIFSEQILQSTAFFDLLVDNAGVLEDSTNDTVVPSLELTQEGRRGEYTIDVGQGDLANITHRVRVRGEDMSGNRIGGIPVDGVVLDDEFFIIDQVVPQFCAFSGCSPQYDIGTWEDSTISRYFVNKADRVDSQLIAIEFGVNEDLGELPVATIGSRPFSQGCTLMGDTTQTYRCINRLSGNETGGLQGVVIQIQDPAGNTRTRAFGEFLYDFDGPEIIAPSIDYEPSPTAPLSRITALGSDSKLFLSFSTNQLSRLSGAEIACPGTESTYPLNPATDDGNTFTYVVDFEELSPTPADGTCQAQAQLTDIVYIKPPVSGNGPEYSTVTPADSAGYTLTVIGNSDDALSESIWIDNTQPTLSQVLNTSSIKHLRMPVGAYQAGNRDGEGYEAAQFIVSNDLPDTASARGSKIPVSAFDLAEGNGSTACSNEKCGGTATCNSTLNQCITVRLLRFYNSSGDKTAGTLLGSIDFLGFDAISINSETSESELKALRLSSDSSEVWVEAVDTAGNISSREAVTSEWIVSLSGRTSLNENVHPVDGIFTTFTEPLLTQNYRTNMIETDGVAAVDAEQLVTVGSPMWSSFSLNFEAPFPTKRLSPGMVYDTSRNRVILFGGQDINDQDAQLWEYTVDSKLWAKVSLPNSPSIRTAPTMVYDNARQVVVLFGGTEHILENSTATNYDDTWEYTPSDGTWSSIDTDSSPTSRSSAPAVFDEANGRILLFGGKKPNSSNDDNESLSDTWVYDTSTLAWTKLTIPANQAPTARHGSSMAYNTSTNEIFLFGGESKDGTGSAETFLNDVWRFETATSTWTKLTTINPPSPRGYASMVYNPDRDRFYLLGGRTAIGSPPVEDGQTPSEVSQEQWELNPANLTWTAVTPTTNMGGQYGAGLVYATATQEMISFGGQSEDATTTLGATLDYTFSRNSWINRATDSNMAPNDRRSHAMVENPVSRELFMYGGYIYDIVDGLDGTPSEEAQLVANSEMWVYSEEAMKWTEQAEATGNKPGPLGDHGMVYTTANNPAYNRVLIFGGQSRDGADTVYHDKIWTYDPLAASGTNPWDEVSVVNPPSQRPTARIGHAMAYSPTDNKMLVFGGQVADGPDPGSYPDYRSDTWVYDVANRSWSTAAGGPSARAFSKLVHLPGTDKFILFGGMITTSEDVDASGFLDPDSFEIYQDTWEFDLSTNSWDQLTPTQSPDGVYAQSMAYSAKRGRIVMFGGHTEAYNTTNNTWEYDPATNNWTRMTPSRSASPRAYSAMAWDSYNNTMQLVGGCQNEMAFDDHWVLLPGDASQTVTASPAEILMPENTAVQEIKTFWSAGGTGATWIPSSETVQGANLYAWDYMRGWILVASNSESSSAPNFLQWSTNNTDQVRRLLADNSSSVHFMLRSVAGPQSINNTVATDYAEIRVRYTPGQN